MSAIFTSDARSRRGYGVGAVAAEVAAKAHCSAIIAR
jgi:hypothetical protein